MNTCGIRMFQRWPHSIRLPLEHSLCREADIVHSTQGGGIEVERDESSAPDLDLSGLIIIGVSTESESSAVK